MSSKYLIEAMKKSQEYDAVIKLLNDNEENLKSMQNILEDNKKHMKGYMFDSLVYRFKDYQAKAFQSEVNDYKYRRNTSEIEARQIINDRHNRDLMRFIEILDEAIGEHD